MPQVISFYDLVNRFYRFRENEMFSFLKDKLVLTATQDGSRIEKGEDVRIISFKSTFQIRQLNGVTRLEFAAEIIFIYVFAGDLRGI